MTDHPDLPPPHPAGVFYGRPGGPTRLEDARRAVRLFQPTPPSPQAVYRRARERLVASISDLLITSPVKDRWRLLREQIVKVERALAADTRNNREFIAVEKFAILEAVFEAVERWQHIADGGDPDEIVGLEAAGHE